MARNAEKLDALSDSISSTGIETATFTADLAETQNIVSAVEAIHAKFGRIDVLYYAPNPLSVVLPVEVPPATRMLAREATPRRSASA